MCMGRGVWCVGRQASGVARGAWGAGVPAARPRGSAAPLLASAESGAMHSLRRNARAAARHPPGGQRRGRGQGRGRGRRRGRRKGRGRGKVRLRVRVRGRVSHPPAGKADAS